MLRIKMLKHSLSDLLLAECHGLCLKFSAIRSTPLQLINTAYCHLSQWVSSLFQEEILPEKTW